MKRFPRDKEAQAKLDLVLPPHLDYTLYERYHIARLSIPYPTCVVCGKPTHYDSARGEFKKTCDTCYYNPAKLGQGKPLPEDFAEHANLHQTVEALSRHYSVSSPVIKRWAKEASIALNNKWKRAREKEEAVTSYLEQHPHATVSEIAEATSLPDYTVLDIATKRNLPLLKQQERWQLARDEAFTLLQQNEHLYHTYQMEEIAEKLGINYGYVQQYRIEHNLPIKAHTASKAEADFLAFLQSLDDSIQPRRNFFGLPYWVDGYSTRHNLAFEFNGYYWHSERPTYHQDKRKAIEAYCPLIQIWEYDWVHKRAICEDLLRAKLNIGENLYARKCSLRELSRGESQAFFAANHLKGYTSSSLALALEHDGKIVIAASFRRHSIHQWELARLASRGSLVVVGGLSRLLKHFHCLTQATSLLSYADCDISTGNAYHKAGFQLIGETGPSYGYVNTSSRYVPRQALMRANFMKAYPTLDASGSEAERAKLLKLKRVYQSGNLKFLKTWP